MNHFRYLIFFTFLVIGNFANAESYVVNTPALNIRSCAGTNCEVIGKLSEGDSVNSIKDHGEWVEIETDTGSGFVIKRSLGEETSIAVTIASGIVSLILLILGICIALFIYLLPSKVAANNKNADKIYWVNLFFGWVPMVWLVLLLAALIGESKDKE